LLEFIFLYIYVYFHHFRGYINTYNIFFLIDYVLYILIRPPIVFRFIFISSDYFKNLYNHLPNVSVHVLHIIHIFTYISCLFYNKIILKYLRNTSLELLPLLSHDFQNFITSETCLKIKISRRKLVLWDDALARYNLIIYVVWSIFSFNKDQIDLTQALATVASN
jgi:hypothetical protein